MESRTVIRPNEIAHLEIECTQCGRSTLLPFNPPEGGPSQPPGHYAFERCLWCSASFPAGLKTALEHFRNAIRFFSGDVPFQVRFVIKTNA